jgi:membrane-bound ClpP family serine protease
MIADWLIVLLLLISGLIMLLTEMFLLGIFVVGILGVVFMIIGIVLSHMYFGSEIGMTVMVSTIVMTLVTMYHALNRRTWSFMTSDKYERYAETDYNTTPKTPLTLGQEGLTLSALRPMGTAQFGNESFEVRTFGKYLDNNSIIYIAKIDRRKIYVKSVESFKAS